MSTNDNYGLILEALSFAADMHRCQRRKDNRDTPYINHPIDVARLLATVGGITDTKILVAGILHDTIEDTEATADVLERKFGREILSIVLECTDDKSLPKQERKRLQVETASHKSDPAKCVKLADKISNIKDVGAHPPADWPEERVREYLNWSERVVAGLRGANKKLEDYYDATLAEARKAVDERYQ